MLDSYNNYMEYFKGKVPNGNYKRLGITFETREKKYFYDAGTGKVLECSQDEYTILKYITENNIICDADSLPIERKRLLAALENIKQMMEKEAILQMPDYDHFEPYSREYIEQKVNKEFKQLILEVTQSCNLRCGYCIYSDGDKEFRNFSNHYMEWPTAQKAIDYALEHSGETIAITFYGGEPLLNYELLKKCMEYCKLNTYNKKVTFSFTTNLTLMTPEKAEYFAQLGNCNIMGSIDGPEPIHNRFRKTAEQKGSFFKAMEGLKNLITAYGDKSEKLISINAVLAPPYSSVLYDNINSFLRT